MPCYMQIMPLFFSSLGKKFKHRQESINFVGNFFTSNLLP